MYKYRIKENTLNNGTITYNIQVKKSLFWWHVLSRRGTILSGEDKRKALKSKSRDSATFSDINEAKEELKRHKEIMLMEFNEQNGNRIKSSKYIE